MIQKLNEFFAELDRLEEVNLFSSIDVRCESPPGGPRGYLVPRRDGRLLAGSTTEKAGYAKDVTAGAVSTILKNVHEISPTFAQLDSL